jgi:asparagine synthase (glutamine-hydrolysing)
MSWNGARPNVEAVSAMCDLMTHRGPDAGHVVDLGRVVLGHRRLAIIDVASTNDQPQFDNSGQLCLVFNGEIYNFRELRSELERCGARFRTDGDTEVVLEAYRRWSLDCVDYLNGMFAFALWDMRSQQLLLARDRVGEKPLFYARVDSGFVFASEPRALRSHPAVSRAVDIVALGHYLELNYVTGDRCLTEGMRRLAPAHRMIVDASGSTRIDRYWDLAKSFREKQAGLTVEDASERLKQLINESVKARMISDVPLGAFLSGGIDSATIVGAMAREAPSRVKTFSVGFGEPGFDEIDDARSTAAHFGTEHFEARLSPDVAGWLQSIAIAADEPLADTSAMPTWFLAQFARQRVTVALSGDGGDEAFAGYETYVADTIHRVGSRLPRMLQAMIAKASDFTLPVSFGKVPLNYKVRAFLAGLPLPADRAHFSWRTIFTNAESAELLIPDARRTRNGANMEAYSEFESHLDEVKDLHPLDRALYVDIKTWLPDDILVKVDRATMAHSLEARAPFLDPKIMEFAASLPPQFKLRGFEKKHLLKRSQVGTVPTRTLSRRKLGFNAPISRWIAGPMLPVAREILYDPSLATWFRRSKIESLLDEHVAMKRDNGYRLFGLICFGLWLKAL